VQKIRLAPTGASDCYRYRWEESCRRAARRTGRRLAKSYRRDPDHPEYGRYKLLNRSRTTSDDGPQRGAKHFPGTWLALAEVFVELWTRREKALTENNNEIEKDHDKEQR
jgi:hypothetical protein